MNLRPSGYEPDELPGCSTAQLQPSPVSMDVKPRLRIRQERL